MRNRLLDSSPGRLKTFLRRSTLAVCVILASRDAFAGDSAVDGKLTAGLAAFDKADYESALSLLVPLAENGNAEASSRIGKMFESGLGVPQNYKWAYVWYRRAERNGMDSAAGDAQRLVAKLTPKALDEGNFWGSQSRSKLNKKYGCISYDGTVGDGQDIISFQESATVAQMVNDIVNYSGLRKNFIVRQANVPNAAAVIDPPFSSNRLLLYNPGFIEDVRRVTGTAWGPYSIMAHEIGHHLQGHTLGSGGSRPDLELQADEFSGFILFEMGATLDEAEAAMRRFGSDSASQTHPAKADRLSAITSGYNRGRQLHPEAKIGQHVNPPPLPEEEVRGEDLPKRETIPGGQPGGRGGRGNPYPVPQVASICQTQFGSCPMRMAIPQGSVCYCVTMQGLFPGVAY